MWVSLGMTGGPGWRTPSIIELRLSSSDRIRQSGMSLAMVAIPMFCGLEA
jgi:hypothetical protein